MVNVRSWPRLCKNPPNLVADGTALHIDYKIASDETLISHLGIGKAREPLQFTTSSFHFAFLHSLGRKRKSETVDFEQSERPLSGKADIGNGPSLDVFRSISLMTQFEFPSVFISIALAFGVSVIRQSDRPI